MHLGVVWVLQFISMRAESTRLSLVVASVDGGLLANLPALVAHLHDGCVLKCRQCACMVPVGGKSVASACVNRT